MDELLQFVKKSDPKKTRKRSVNKAMWKSQQLKVKRYRSKGLPIFPQCNHNTKSFKCSELTCQQIGKFHRNFYSCTSKQMQDNYILKFCDVTDAKTTKKENSRRKVAIKYYVMGQNGRKIPVCQKTFTNALLIKKDRVQGVMNRFHISGGMMPKENRGGDRKSSKFEHKKVSVQSFIESFKGQESHYCRSKTNERIYLAPDLNIRKMWRMYNNTCQPDLKVKQHFFRNIFNCHYNIGFGNPRTDVCSTCLALIERIKTEKNKKEEEQDKAKINEWITEKRIHRLRYKEFYKILREGAEDMETISFDCQKNQPLPKVPDQSAYYSRQFNFYNFTIVKGNSKAHLSKENVHSYCWNETSHQKGSNEIISAAYHFLKQNYFNENVKTLRVVCDGCSGQNKNTGMIAMLAKWLVDEAPKNIKKIEIVFPVVGHSFIPPDRVFAKIEKELKTREVVVSPSEYQSVLQEHAQCTDLTTIPVYDFKKACLEVIKPTGSWHFPFMKSKRFFITRTKTQNFLLQGELSYRNEMNLKKTVTKKNKKISMIDLREIQPNTLVPKKTKVADVQKLLQKHFGNEWKDLRNLEFYKMISERVDNGETEDTVGGENDLCEEGFDDVINFV